MTTAATTTSIIPDNATIRQEYVKCSNLDCKKIHEPHGPYLYAYWKDPESKKLKKKYVGKSWDDWAIRKVAKLHQVEPR